MDSFTWLNFPLIEDKWIENVLLADFSSSTSTERRGVETKKFKKSLFFKFFKLKNKTKEFSPKSPVVPQDWQCIALALSSLLISTETYSSLVHKRLSYKQVFFPCFFYCQRVWRRAESEERAGSQGVGTSWSDTMCVKHLGVEKRKWRWCMIKEWKEDERNIGKISSAMTRHNFFSGSLIFIKELKNAIPSAKRLPTDKSYEETFVIDLHYSVL